MKIKPTRYHVYKVFASKTKIHICAFDTRNEARRLEEILWNSNHPNWVPEIFTEILEKSEK